MSMSNTTEAATLDMLLRGIDPSWRSAATQYVALFTADPGEAGSLAAEATYTGYARVPVTKATAWAGTSSPFTNAGLIQFAACTAGTNTITHFAVVDTASGAVAQMISGSVPGGLSVSSGVQPQFGAGALSIGGD